MPSRDRLQRQLLELSIITFITVIIWISYEVYSTLTSPIATNIASSELQKIPPPLKSEQFSSLRERFVIDDELLSDFSLTSGELPEIPALPTLTPATPSPVATPSSEATGSASTP